MLTVEGPVFIGQNDLIRVPRFSMKSSSCRLGSSNDWEEEEDNERAVCYLRSRWWRNGGLAPGVADFELLASTFCWRRKSRLLDFFRLGLSSLPLWLWFRQFQSPRSQQPDFVLLIR
jgi:hypothetical protein